MEQVGSLVTHEQGLEQGLAQGLSQGERKKAVEIARNMLALGVSPDIVEKSSGLSKHEVMSLMD